MKGNAYMHNSKRPCARLLALGLSLLLLAAAAALPAAALEPYGNNVRIRNWVSNDPEYTFSEAYMTSVWYKNFTELELTANPRDNVLRIALSQLGYHEGDSAKDFSGKNQSGSSNYIEYARLVVPNYNDNHYEWCACFVNWCLSQAHVDYAYGEIGCWKWVEWLKENDLFEDSFAYGGDYVPQPADMIFFNWKGVNTGSGHIGYVLYVTDTAVYTVEGNSKDEVGIRSYALDDPCVIGFGTPKYEEHAGENAEETIDFSCSGGLPQGRYILTKDRVSLSSAPDKNDRLARLSLGSTVVLLDTDGNRAHVIADGKEGWVSVSSLQLLNPLPSATFKADGTVAAQIPFEKGELCCDPPAVPEKSGYTGAWSSFTAGTDDVMVEPVYTPIQYTVTFVADGKTVAEIPFTIEDQVVTAPEVPVKDGFTGEWPKLTLTLSDITIEAVYTAVTESATAAPMDISDTSAEEKTEEQSGGCMSSASLLSVLMLSSPALPLLRKKKH
jgi:hypothetical protein